MPETIYKTFRAEIKSVDEEDGSIDMLIPISTASMDRDGEVIEVGAWKKTLPKFKKRPVLLSGHDYRDLRKHIGEFAKLKVTDEGLLGSPKYYVNEGNDEADWAFNLAKKGMAAFSVGFIPLTFRDGDGEKEPKRIYEEVELLEISQVVVPSNRDAIQGMRSKSANPIVQQLCDEIEKEILIDLEVITKPEETENYIRIPAKGEEGKHDGHRIRTITLDDKKGIKALYCGECKIIITYLFDKDKGWTMESARAWVKEHEKGISQAALKDELDYVKALISKGDLNESNKKLAQELANEILLHVTPMIDCRITGSDMPVEINPSELLLEYLREKVKN